MEKMDQILEQMKSLQAEVDSLKEDKRRLQTLEDKEQIKNVMHAYEYLHYPITFPQKLNLFALDLPDVSFDVGDSGVFVGREGIETIFLKILGTARFAKGAFFMHCVTTPIIEVAKDGKTARAVFMSPGFETYYEDHNHSAPACYKPGMAPMAAYWCWGKYSGDFIKINGEWKIWHLKWWRDIRCDYYKSWVDDTGATSERTSYNKREDAAAIQDVPFHKPMKFHQPYNQTQRKVPVPVAPLPYDTWRDEDIDWPMREYEDLIGKTEYDIEDRMW